MKGSVVRMNAVMLAAAVLAAVPGVGGGATGGTSVVLTGLALTLGFML